jgi:predicted glycosyltransferase
MKILIDINHPAHVHYFKNFIKIMEKNGHNFLVISRNKEIEHYLLKKYNIPYINRGKGSKNFWGKFYYLFKADYLIFKQAKEFKPDIFLSFLTPYSAHVSKFLNKPYIAIDDTEHAKLSHFLSLPFADVILTPSCYTKDLGKKQIRYNGYQELLYLHPNYFSPNPEILNYLGVSENEKYVIIRFVAWNASHDIGQNGINLDIKRKIVYELSKYAKVFISSEGELPEDIKQYQIKIPPEMMHDALFYATLFIGEGATMASECACLGIPAIYINSLAVGYCSEEDIKYNLVYNFRNSDGIIEKAIEILSMPNLKQQFQLRRQKMLSEKIDVTAFLVWFVENYPESVSVMKKNPNYQYRFR